jgi:hypothetical protein
MMKQREEVLNTVLAQVLIARGMSASPETIHSEGMPDVIVPFRGLRCALEGKLDDVSSAKAVVVRQAKGRGETGVAHIAIAIVYPTALRTTPFSELAPAISDAQLRFRVCTESSIRDWKQGTADDILEELRRAHEDIIRDDVVQDAVTDLNLGLAGVSEKLLSSSAVCDRLMTLLGIGEPEHETDEDE